MKIGQCNKLITAMLLLLSVACTSGKDGGGDKHTEPLPTPTNTPNAASADNGPSSPTPNPSLPADFKEGDNSANSLSFDTAVTQEQMAAMEAEAAKYSGASEDALREYLASKASEVSDSVQKSKNMKFASMIVTAKLKVSDDKKSFKVVLKVIDVPTKEKFLAFAGTSQPAKDPKSGKTYLPRKIELKAFDKDGKEFKNQNGTLECADQKFTTMFDCQTKLATINLNGATAKIIMRSSGADQAAHFSDSKCITKQCDELYELFTNSAYQVKSANRLKSVTFESFEIINGRSAFNILMLTYGNEVMKMEGNLEALDESSRGTLDTRLNMQLGSDELKDPVTKQSRKTRLNSELFSSFLRDNDGKGNIIVKVRMAMDKEAGDRDVFEINFSRNINSIRVLN